MTLFCSLVKKDNFEWVLEKGTELGVSGFVPILSERSEKKNLNMERGKRIIREASEQSGRGVMPNLYGVHDLSRALETFDMDFVAFDPTGKPFDKDDIMKGGRIGILIGPEGGWSGSELELFRQKDISVYSLGTQVLRAETAAVSISSLLLL